MTGDDAASRLAAALVETEERLAAERPAKVVIGGAADEDLATALVAAKLLIPIELVPGEGDEDPAQATNRRLIALLAG